MHALHLCNFLSIDLPVYLCLSIYLYLFSYYLSIYLSINLSIYIYISIYLSTYLFVCISVFRSSMSQANIFSKQNFIIFLPDSVIHVSRMFFNL